jgi:hypothetical protein
MEKEKISAVVESAQTIVLNMMALNQQFGAQAFNPFPGDGKREAASQALAGWGRGS